MITARSCNIGSWSGPNLQTTRHCSTHNMTVPGQNSYTCPMGQLEQYMCVQIASEITVLQIQLNKLDNQITPSLRKFADNLEKLHEPDTGPPTTKPG